jgi:hypothetical protein
MFAEVDRQLAEVREQCNSVATRSGLLISANAVAAAVLVAGLNKVNGGELVAFAALGIATLAGIATLFPGLETGPNTVNLTGWATSSPAQTAVADLYSAKVIALTANRQRMAVMTWAFYLQGVLTLVAVVLALVVAGRR